MHNGALLGELLTFNLKHQSLECHKWLQWSSVNSTHIHRRLIFTKENITIHGINFKYKKNVSPFAYIYVTETGGEALIYNNKPKGRLRESFDLNDGRLFAFHKCHISCRRKRNEILGYQNSNISIRARMLCFEMATIEDNVSENMSVIFFAFLPMI